MNPRNLDIDTLLALLAEHVSLTPEQAEQAVANMKESMQNLVTMLKRINEPMGNIRLDQSVENILIIALWAVVFNKTMPEATDIYCKLLMNTVTELPKRGA